MDTTGRREMENEKARRSFSCLESTFQKVLCIHSALILLVFVDDRDDDLISTLHFF